MTEPSPLLTLFQPEDVRRKAHMLLDRAVAGDLAHVGVDLDNLDRAIETVLETTRENYPDFQIPPYGIWRDLEAGGIDRWGALASARAFETAGQMLAAATDLAVLATCMTTLHPAGWSYEDRMTQTRVGGRTASVLAAFHMFAAGSFSSEMSDPYRVDAETLVRLDLKELAAGLQWDEHRDAQYLQAMQRHLKRLGEALALRPDLFGAEAATRPGLLAIALAQKGDGTVDAGDLIDRLLDGLAPVWDGGAVQGDMVFGDCFAHSGLPGGAEETLVPFHLAAQEMVYALVEPFAWAGFEVSGLEKLTGPSDLVHAALFVKTGVLSVKDAAQAPEVAPEISREVFPEAAVDRMIELRAVTLALTDRLADRLAGELGTAPGAVPLTCILEGGTARAGTRILEQASSNMRDLRKFLNPGAVFWLPFGA